MNFRIPIIYIISLSTLSVLLQGCGLMFGTNSKVDTKNHDYVIYRLDQDPNHDWRILVEEYSNESFQDRSDIAFESRSSKAIVSLNSVCGQATQHNLKQLSKNLLLGLGQPNEISSRNIKVDGTVAEESTLRTMLSESSSGSMRTAQIRTVVMKKNGCTYDFMYITKPEYFEAKLEEFNKFIQGFHVK